MKVYASGSLCSGSNVRKEEEMRRLTSSIMILALVVAVVGCSSMQLNVKEPQAAKMTPKAFWGGWSDQSETLPVSLEVFARSSWRLWGKDYLYRITDIPLKPGVTLYARVRTFGPTEFTRAAQVPVVINDQDIQDVMRGNVVRIVVVDPKKEYQTSQFESLRLSPTDDVVERAEEIGDLLVLVTLGNRDPFAK